MNTHQSRHIKSDPPKYQAVTWLFFCLIITIAALFYLTVKRWDSLAYMITDYSVVTGFNALKNSWPIYALIGGIAILIGVIVGTLSAKTAKQRSAEARALRAESLADDAQKSAEKAHDDAQAAFSEQMRQAELIQQRAREEIAAAKATRTAAIDETAHARKRVADLEKKLGRAESRLNGALRAMQKGEANAAELRAELSVLKGELL